MRSIQGTLSSKGEQSRLSEDLHSRRAGVLSPQVLGELFSTATQKLPQALTVADAERLVGDYVRSWPVHDLTAQTVVAAVRGLRRYQLSCWDALIWATAREHRVSYVLSEDFNDGANLEGVRFRNPFNQSFDLALL